MSDGSSPVERLDSVIDGWFDPLRGRPVPDRVFEIASHVGDWGLIWMIVIAAQALRSDNDLRRSPRLVAAFLGESILVNQIIKRIFRRGRPGDRPEVSDRLREPITSSFPSGHASSAALAAALLTEGDPALRPVVIPIGVVVATSRIHTRMHHPSDVLAGAVTGWLIGKAIVRHWPDPHRSRRRVR